MLGYGLRKAHMDEPRISKKDKKNLLRIDLGCYKLREEEMNVDRGVGLVHDNFMDYPGNYIRKI